MLCALQCTNTSTVTPCATCAECVRNGRRSIRIRSIITVWSTNNSIAHPSLTCAYQRINHEITNHESMRIDARTHSPKTNIQALVTMAGSISGLEHTTQWACMHPLMLCAVGTHKHLTTVITGPHNGGHEPNNQQAHPLGHRMRVVDATSKQYWPV